MKYFLFVFVLISTSSIFAQLHCDNISTADILDRKFNGPSFPGAADEFGIISTTPFAVTIDNNYFASISYTIPQGNNCAGYTYHYVSFDTDGDTSEPFYYNVSSQQWHQVTVQQPSNTYNFSVRPPHGTEIGADGQSGQPDFLLLVNGDMYKNTFTNGPNNPLVVDIVRKPYDTTNPQRLGYSIGTYGGSGSAARTAYTADCYCNEMGYQNGASYYYASSTSGVVMYKESGSDWQITGSSSIHLITNITCDEGLYKKNTYQIEIKTDFLLEQNYPNPFNPTTELSFYLSKNSYVTLKIFDVLGKEVTTLADKMYESGSYTFNFDASNLPSGVYFYTLNAGNFTETKKMILAK